MANFYLDTSAVGNEYQAYADTPASWAVPQDGNGLAGPGHAAAVAVATLDVAGCTASGTGTIGVLGVTVSSTLNATGAALATAIAAAINASGSAVSATYSAALLPLNRLVYARVNPGLNTQVQIMLRIAGVDWNGMAPTQANISPAATVGAFAGGANGPFAYLANNTAAFGKAAFVYGLTVSKSSGVADPAASGNDPIIVRTKRGGANLSTVLTGTSLIVLSCPANTSRTFIFDDGTTWAGDNGQYLLSLTTTDGFSSLSWQGNSTSFTTLRAIARAKYGLKILFTQPAANNNYTSSFASSSGVYFHNVEVEAGNATTNLQLIRSNTTNPTFFSDCTFTFRTNVPIVASIGNNFWGQVHQFIRCSFNWVIGADLTSVLSFSTSNSSFQAWMFDSCTFSVDGGASQVGLFVSGGNNVGRVLITAENCVGIDNKSVGIAAASSMAGGQYYSSNARDGRSYRYETQNVVVDWDALGSFPYIPGTTDPEGNAFGTRVQWGATRLGTGYATPVASFSTVHAMADGVRTIDLEMLVPAAEIPSKAQVYATLRYTSDANAVVSDDSVRPIAEHFTGTAPDLDAGVGLGGWTLNGLVSYSSRRIRFVTSQPVKSNTKIEVLLYFGAPPAADRVLYINPELLVS